MMSKKNFICAVCGHTQDTRANVCPKCHTSDSMADRFAGPESLKAWKESMEAKRKAYNHLKRKTFTGSRFYLSEGALSLYFPQKKQTVVIDASGASNVYDGVKQLSINSRHTVHLSEEGTVNCNIRNSDFKHDLSDLKNVSYVYAGAKATYYVSDGKMNVRGIDCLNKNFEGWENVSKIVGCNGRVAALSEKGDVYISHDGENIEVNEHNATDIATARNFTVWVRKNGTVGCIGSLGDTRMDAANWTDIVSVAVDSYIVVGLKVDGTVVCAGEFDTFFDMGRSDIRSWKNVIAITASGSGIAGLFEDGTIKIAGHIENKDEIAKIASGEIKKYW